MSRIKIKKYSAVMPSSVATLVVFLRRQGSCGDAEFGTACSGVVVDFFVAGADWATSEHLEAAVFAEGMFNQAIFERMEADDR